MQSSKQKTDDISFSNTLTSGTLEIDYFREFYRIYCVSRTVILGEQLGCENDERVFSCSRFRSHGIGQILREMVQRAVDDVVSEVEDRDETQAFAKNIPDVQI